MVRSGTFESGDYVELILTSQTWRGIPWKHQLFLFRPKRSRRPRNRPCSTSMAAAGIRNTKASAAATLPRQARIFTRLAESMHAPLAILRQVPFQPLFDRREDALIAYTFDRYLETGDDDWPLLLPMVKSAVRAMDTVQSVARAAVGSARSSVSRSPAHRSAAGPRGSPPPPIRA